MISYAQNLEDVLLQRALKDIDIGFYVDVGANSPTKYSLTLHFYRAGWSGINFEPGDFYPEVVAHRPRDINLNVAVSAQVGEATLYVFPGEGITTLSKLEAETHRTERGWRYVEQCVPLMSLAHAFRQHVTTTIDFMSVDVEGHERSVLLSNDWAACRPRIVVVEATRPCSTEATHHLWEDVLLDADYRFATFDGLNRFYVRAEDEHRIALLAVQPNVFDGYVPSYWHDRTVALEAALESSNAEIARLKLRAERGVGRHLVDAVATRYRKAIGKLARRGNRAA